MNIDFLKNNFADLQYQKPHIDDCVYFLLDGEEIVYVGYSQNLLQRILDHKRDGYLTYKNFNNIYYIPLCDYKSEGKTLESALIKTLKPIYNRTENVNKPLSKREKEILNEFINEKKSFIKEYANSNP